MLSRNFHSRVLWLFVGLILLSQLGTTAATLIVTQRDGYRVAEQRLQVAGRIWDQTLISRTTRLHDSMRVLASDTAFRSAVKSGEIASIDSALFNHGARIHADVSMLLDSNGRIVAATDPIKGADRAFPFPEFLSAKAEAALRPEIVTINDRLMQLVVVRINAPETIGILCMGFDLDDALASELKELAGVEVSLAASDPARGTAIVASTLAAADRSALHTASSQIIESEDAQYLRLSKEEYLTAWMPSAFGKFSAVFQLSSREVNALSMELRRELLWLGGIITAVCLVIAAVCARILSQPVRALATAARSIRTFKRRSKGDNNADDDELAQLTTVFHALAERAHYDALTGLPNRSLASQRISESIARAARDKESFAVVFIDLNGFKKINDTLGHDVGDLVLRKTAKRLLRSMREGDTVARLGGDEFLLVLEKVSQYGALRIVDGLISVVGQPMDAEQGPIQVGMSAGISIYPFHARDKAGLLKLADLAMYESKSRRFGPVVYKMAETPTEPPADSAEPVAEPACPNATGTINEEMTSTWTGARFGQADLMTAKIKAIGK